MRRGGSIYDHPQYVEQYVAAVRPDVLCFDRYPSFGFQMSPPPETVMRPINDTCTHTSNPLRSRLPRKTSEDNRVLCRCADNESGVFRNARDGYLHALSTVRSAALRANVPLWNYFKAAGIYESKAKDRNGINPAPTEAEIRCDRTCHLHPLPLLLSACVWRSLIMSTRCLWSCRRLLG